MWALFDSNSEALALTSFLRHFVLSSDDFLWMSLSLVFCVFFLMSAGVIKIIKTLLYEHQ